MIIENILKIIVEILRCICNIQKGNMNSGIGCLLILILIGMLIFWGFAAIISLL